MSYMCAYSIMHVCVQHHTCVRTASYMYAYSIIHVCVQHHTCVSTASYMCAYIIIHVCVQHHTCVCTAYSGAHFLTFFFQRDFFCWRDCFFAGVTFFFCWRDFFHAGATFFLVRLFSSALICRPLLVLFAGSNYEHV